MGGGGGSILVPLQIDPIFVRHSAFWYYAKPGKLQTIEAYTRMILISRQVCETPCVKLLYRQQFVVREGTSTLEFCRILDETIIIKIGCELARIFITATVPRAVSYLWLRNVHVQLYIVQLRGFFCIQWKVDSGENRPMTERKVGTEIRMRNSWTILTIIKCFQRSKQTFIYFSLNKEK
jgi:hypothetical protein